MRTVSSSVLPTLLTAALLLGSCGLTESNEKVEQTEADSSYIRATLNDTEEWSGKLRGYFSKGGGDCWLTISIRNAHKDQLLYTEKLVFVVVFRGVKTYPLVEIDREWDETGASYYEKNGDALISSYHPTDDTSANQLTITSYDSTTSLIEGSFRTTVVVDSTDRGDEPGEPPRRRPDTLHFTDGEFRVNVEDRR